jgi:hypothetical protein
MHPVSSIDPRSAMKALIALLPTLMAAACATAPQATQTVERYPAWLEMKPGWAETCAAEGCVPVTQRELQELANDVHQRTLVMCRRSRLSAMVSPEPGGSLTDSVQIAGACEH